ncbi:replicative DNA helicase [Streptomonospora nanhaiensis]|uniref:replicative DNA helicase n=1 Tax=Streptomonospora nanhaiensis TaxID=1323731 RepID=UPI001C3867C1|nr:replicative DNA helicase [Streptomonospora nanhaiensis]MBV2366958.1 replicative DNA helicase [Streptomonospora nanhaiensis]
MTHTAPRHLAPVGDTTDAEPPHDLDAEQVVIGAAIQDQHALDTVTDIIRDPADFYRPAHQVIYATARDMADRGHPLGAVAVNAELAKRGEGARVGGALYLHECAAKVPALANAGYYARIVAEKAALRRLVEAGTRIAQIGYTGVGDIDDILDHARAAADAATEPPTTETTAMTLAERMPDYIDRLESGRTSDNLIPPPYKTLRRLIPGFAPGQLIAVGARPGSGKSVMAVDILRSVCLHQGLPGILFSLEMTGDEVMDRVYAAEAEVNLAKFTRRLAEEDWQRVSAAQPRVTAAPMTIDDSSSISLAHIRSRLRAMSRRNPARIAIVDYLQLMSMPKADTREQSIAATTRDLKLMAREFNVPIVVLAQLNRGLEGRQDKMPGLADFRESGAIEQDANIAIMLHRPENHDPDTPRAGELDLHVAKNRSGPLGVETVQAQFHYARAVDFDDPRALGARR